MQKAIFIEGNRNGYGPDQCEHRTMTVGELIGLLEEMADAYGEDAKVFLRNDNGYTYGSVSDYDVQPGCYDSHRAYMEGDAEFDECFGY